MSSTTTSQTRLRLRSGRRSAIRLRVEALENRIVPAVNFVESESNNTPATADVIARLPATQVIVSGAVNALGDRDWFRLDLQAGDVIGCALKGQNGLNPALRLVDSTGALLVGNDDCQAVGRMFLPRESPLPYTTRSATDSDVYYVASTAGTYFLEVSASGDASAGRYDLDTMTARPGLESQPVGTHQVLFLDFGGGIARFNGTKWPMASLADSLPLIGQSAADENAFIDSVVARITDKLQTFVRANGLNGDYSATGIPGQFDIEIRNSRDSVSDYGTNPYESRIMIGWTSNTVLANTHIGLAECIDVGNFKTDDQAVVSLNWATFAIGGFSVQPPATRLDMIAEFTALIAAHEFGHLAGCFHTDFSASDPFAGTRTIMDKSLEAPLGPDLTFGTADDVTIQLGTDAYDRNYVINGLQDTLNTVAFGLSTGKGTTYAYVHDVSEQLETLAPSGVAFGSGVVGWSSISGVTREWKSSAIADAVSQYPILHRYSSGGRQGESAHSGSDGWVVMHADVRAGADQPSVVAAGTDKLGVTTLAVDETGGILGDFGDWPGPG